MSIQSYRESEAADPRCSRVELFALSWRAELTDCEFYTMIFILSKTIMMGDTYHVFAIEEFTMDDSSYYDIRMRVPKNNKKRSTHKCAGTKVTPVNHDLDDVYYALHSLERKDLIEISFRDYDVDGVRRYEDDYYQMLNGIVEIHVNLDSLPKRVIE